MSTLYRLKPGFQALLRPAAHRLHRLGMSANQVTVLACVVSIALGFWLAINADALQWFLLVPLWCFVRMALNAIDGIIARELAEPSALGAYLNELGDVASDAALYLPFALVPGSSVALVGVVILLACLAELAGILGVLVGASRCHDGPMGKSDRAFVFGALGFLVGLGIPTRGWLSLALAAVALLLALTIVNRVRSGIRASERAAARTSRE